MPALPGLHALLEGLPQVRNTARTRRSPFQAHPAEHPHQVARTRSARAPAHDRFAVFVKDRLDDYPEDRNRLDIPGWSAMSPHIHFGEISVRRIWHTLATANWQKNTARETYLRELGWREFAQHQLWIFDATRPQGDLPQFADESGGGLLSQRPVDGGVFNIFEDGEVVIEIDPKLIVGQAAAFAVTVEPPGGVVVSDRSRVPLLALPSQS